MEVINNISKKLGDDLKGVIHSGSHLSVAAACFSIYAFDELRKELEGIKELRFIFTSPSFTTEKASKERKEFFIPRLNRALLIVKLKLQKYNNIILFHSR